jgi:hypothetical protein
MTELTEETQTVEVEVLIETPTFEGGWKPAWEAEIAPENVENFEHVIRVARIGWDETDRGIYGAEKRLTITTFGPACPDGYRVRQTHRP